jgi:hypothetical protein
MARKLAAILYADVFGYSRLMGKDEEVRHIFFWDMPNLPWR